MIEATLSQEEIIEKLVVLPYCWMHMAEESRLRQISRSRIKTKTCLEDMNCTRASLKGLIGVLPGWSCQTAGRGCWVWESRLSVGDQEF